MTGLVLLFAVAFGAATFLPIPSEVLFAAMQVRGDAPVWVLVAVASVGNSLGSIVNFVMGWQVDRFSHRRWFPATPEQMERAKVWYGKWGVWTLLLSWAPLGDAITLVAGVMRTPFWLFMLLVSIAKTGRYIVFALLTAGIVSL